MRQQLSQSAFSEAKLGLVPAVISPYVIRAIGPRRAQQLLLTARKVDANQAREIGLATEILDAETDPAIAVKSLAETLYACGPQALADCKQLIEHMADQPITPELIEKSAQTIARIRVSDEGQEGVRAFIEKRLLRW